MNKIVIQYLIHQILINKNTPTGMNPQKVNLENLKRIANTEKSTLPSLRNI